MAISLLAYVATFSRPLYFWRNCFFILQSNYFYTAVTFSEQLFLQSFYLFNLGAFFFRTTTSSQQLFFQNSYFSREKLLQSNHFLRIGSSLGQVLFGTPTFLAEKLFRIKTLPEKVLFRTRYFCATFSEELLFEKS